jgi:hypothetical protein
VQRTDATATRRTARSGNRIGDLDAIAKRREARSVNRIDDSNAVVPAARRRAHRIGWVRER